MLGGGDFGARFPCLLFLTIALPTVAAPGLAQSASAVPDLVSCTAPAVAFDAWNEITPLAAPLGFRAPRSFHEQLSDSDRSEPNAPAYAPFWITRQTWSRATPPAIVSLTRLQHTGDGWMNSLDVRAAQVHVKELSTCKITNGELRGFIQTRRLLLPGEPGAPPIEAHDVIASFELAPNDVVVLTGGPALNPRDADTLLAIANSVRLLHARERD
jgi:hypothetical protein